VKVKVSVKFTEAGPLPLAELGLGEIVEIVPAVIVTLSPSLATLVLVSVQVPPNARTPAILKIKPVVTNEDEKTPLNLTLSSESPLIAKLESSWTMIVVCLK